ncbi:MAG: RNA 2',3'-cyclic phosphodiesterase [Rhodocyclaceae bacterium]|nr:RNA 2',3'-cyclic phosphodiesterase [Rhodocyclaceae bacterium]
MTDIASHRVFFALWPDVASRGALVAAAKAASAICGGRRQRDENLHLTLAFLGTVTSAKLDTLLAVGNGVRAAPYTLCFDRLGYWQHNRIVWAGCSEVPSAQRRLFALLADSLAAAGFRLDSRPHVPHVTLVRQARCATQLPELAPIPWRVTEFTLVESHLAQEGARYEVLARWPLMEGA